jgi:hypothetical protein
MDCSLPKMQKGRLIQPFACCVMASDPGAGRRRQGALGSGSGSAEIFSSALAVAAILDDVEAHLLAFVQGMHAGALDSGDVNKHIRAAIVRLNEAIALGGIEKLNNTGIHDDFLSIDIEKSGPVFARPGSLIEFEREDRQYARGRKASLTNSIDLANIGACRLYCKGGAVFLFITRNAAGFYKLHQRLAVWP